FRARPRDMTAMLHREADAMATHGTARLAEREHTSWAYHGQARPPEAEVEAIRGVLYLAQVAGAAVYIVHCSTAESSRVVDEARRRADMAPVYCETCPQYFWLDDSRYGAPGA